MDWTIKGVQDGIIDALHAIPMSLNFHVMHGGESGGDYDTPPVIVENPATGEQIHIAGFNTQRCIATDNEIRGRERHYDVEMVEVSDGRDSRGGCWSHDTMTCILYAIVVSKLRQMGYQVVPQMRDFF